VKEEEHWGGWGVAGDGGRPARRAGPRVCACEEDGRKETRERRGRRPVSAAPEARHGAGAPPSRPRRDPALARARAPTPTPTPRSLQIVSPGDRISPLPPSGELRVGPGLDAAGAWLVADAPGVVKETRGGTAWVASRGRRYAPAPGDAVVGRVTDKGGEAYGVDIGAAFPASLPSLAFEGATRRNRPPLAVGDLVLARVAAAGRDVDAELACVDEGGRVRGEGGGGRGDRARGQPPPPPPPPPPSPRALARSAPASCST